MRRAIFNAHGAERGIALRRVDAPVAPRTQRRPVQRRLAGMVLTSAGRRLAIPVNHFRVAVVRAVRTVAVDLELDLLLIVRREADVNPPWFVDQDRRRPRHVPEANREVIIRRGLRA
jgi:hypothetical protein